MLVVYSLKIKNQLDKACFQDDVFYDDFKGLNIRAAGDKVFHDKTFNFAKNPKFDWYQRGHASIIYKFFDKKNVQVEQFKTKIFLIKN